MSTPHSADPAKGIDEASIRKELAFIWAGHHAVGLKGKMSLYTVDGQQPWRTQHENVCYWFGPDDTDKAVIKLKEYYNDGELPNTPLLLNPIVHEVSEDGKEAKPLGSGIMWGTAFALGIFRLDDEAVDRIDELSVYYSPFQRVDNQRAGLKILAFSSKIIPAESDGRSLETNKAFYDIVSLDAPLYYPFYLLSGIKYLSLHGLFNHSHFDNLVPPEESADLPTLAKQKQLDPQLILDARYCWDSYDRIHSLYKKWGRDPKDVPHNNRFFNLCARDVMLFDATGPMRKGADESFDFLVPGLIPRGAITVLAASGGCGKSSIAHELCVDCAIDYKPGDTKPFWLGQPVNVEVAKGVCVYFSGEDGPAIINARGELFDPEGRALRLQFHRANFGGDDTSFADFVTKRLFKMPDIPLLVVDPARKYLSGDEEDSQVVSEFFFALEELAMSKNCAVIVVHHLKKGAKPGSIPEVLDELRGSQVFIDRARVVLGMFRNGVHTHVGLAKNNIPPSLGMVTEERVFVRNPKTLKLMWLPGEDGVRRDILSQDELDRIEFESFKQQVERAKSGGAISADEVNDYIPPSLR
jgi:hypothetical protein